ncbi:MAG: aromatic amino acid lyase, partial [Myxococcales bacterium]|nr:aromatic amino acid lyase [Myxococcales bacterium]
LALLRAEAAVFGADVTGAMTLEAMRGSPRPFDDAVVALRPHPGALAAASHLRALLDASEIVQSHRDCAEVQDAYSLRCMPQVHGAARAALRYVAEAVEIELNSFTDNPLVLGDGVIQSGGNFHGQPVAAALDVAALAVACGYSRSVAIQIGSGNDGSTRYRNLDDNSVMENYHYISHRRASHDSSGEIIAGSDALHAMVDRQFAQTFRYLLDLLSAYELPNADSLLDSGFCLWYNDTGNGPGHSARNIPTVIAGSAGGYLKQGQYIMANNGDYVVNHARLLNALGSAAGLRDANDQPISDFGDAGLDRTPLTDIMA